MLEYQDQRSEYKQTNEELVARHFELRAANTHPVDLISGIPG